MCVYFQTYMIMYIYIYVLHTTAPLPSPGGAV